jgi:F-box/TPR repeat protein Pof3
MDPPRPGNFLTPGQNQLPNLKTLVFNDTPWINPSTLSLFLLHSKAPLRTLHVNLCHNIDAHTFINILLDVKRENPALQQLTEVGVVCMPGMDDGSIGYLWAALPNLKILDLSQTRITGCAIRMIADVRNNGTDFPKVEGLIIKGCDDVSRDAIEYGRQMGLKIVT